MWISSLCLSFSCLHMIHVNLFWSAGGGGKQVIGISWWAKGPKGKGKEKEKEKKIFFLGGVTNDGMCFLLYFKVYQMLWAFDFPSQAIWLMWSDAHTRTKRKKKQKTQGHAGHSEVCRKTEYHAGMYGEQNAGKCQGRPLTLRVVGEWIYIVSRRHGRVKVAYERHT